MKYLNIPIAVLTSEDYLGSEPTDRATWLNLMAYCARQETGGIITGARCWGDRKWAQLCGVFKAEIDRACPLWDWEGEDIIVRHYPSEQEAVVRRQREAGKNYGRGQNPSKPEPEKPEITEKPAVPEKYAEIVRIWNEAAETLTKKTGKRFAACAKLTSKRKSTLHQRFQEDKNYIESFQSACTALERSPFHLGKNDRGWVADFDYMIRPDTVTKLIEQHPPQTVQPKAVWRRVGTEEYRCPFCYRSEPVHRFEDATGNNSPRLQCLACGRNFKDSAQLRPFPPEEKPHRFDPENEDIERGLPENPTEEQIREYGRKLAATITEGTE